MFPCQKQALQLIKNSQLVFHGLSTRALSPMSANKMHEHGRHGLGEVMDEDPISGPCHPAHPAHPAILPSCQHPTLHTAADIHSGGYPSTRGVLYIQS